MISIEEAKARIFQSLRPVGAENISLGQAHHRILAEALFARRTQPPADVSAMDGYAVRHLDCQTIPARLKVVGTAPAGQAWTGSLDAGQAVRIFTGGLVPHGADAVVIQENTKESDGYVDILKPPSLSENIRLKGQDFFEGQQLYEGGEVLTSRDIALIAALNIPWIKVYRRPRIALLATGDELVQPGDSLTRDDQIVSTNGLALAAMARAWGAEVTDLGIAQDREEDLAQALAAAQGHDLLVTLGGASVGDHDLIRPLILAQGGALDFWKIAMRPGKPLLFGQVGGLPLLGLPGNPVSALVCAQLFLSVALAALTAQPQPGEDWLPALAFEPLEANGPRQDYMRAEIIDHPQGHEGLWVRPFAKQDSSMLSTLARAHVLLVRPPHDPAKAMGDPVWVLPLEV